MHGIEMNKRRKKKLNIIVLILFLLLLYLVGNIISICNYSTKDEKRKADVAIVLGAATYNGEVSLVYQERLNHGVTLYKQGYVGKMIVTGGVGDGNTESDALAAKEYLVAQGIPAADILEENKSTITQENLENSKVIMNVNGYQTAIIVSDPLHMKRSMLLAKDAGIVAYSSPTPTTKYVSLWTKIPFLAREVFFYVGYKWWRGLWLYNNVGEDQNIGGVTGLFRSGDEINLGELGYS